MPDSAIIKLAKREGKDDQLYITGGRQSDWAGVATDNDYTNTEDSRRKWTYDGENVGDGGHLTLKDGMQLYANNKGEVGAAQRNQAGTDNHDELRRTWYQDANTGIVTLGDGRQLYINNKGWACVTHEGDNNSDNNSDERKVWTSLNGKSEATVDRNWVQIKEITGVGAQTYEFVKEHTAMSSLSSEWKALIGGTVKAHQELAVPLMDVPGVSFKTSVTYEMKSEISTTYHKGTTETTKQAEKLTFQFKDGERAKIFALFVKVKIGDETFKFQDQAKSVKSDDDEANAGAEAQVSGS